MGDVEKKDKTTQWDFWVIQETFFTAFSSTTTLSTRTVAFFKIKRKQKDFQIEMSYVATDLGICLRNPNSSVICDDRCKYPFDN